MRSVNWSGVWSLESGVWSRVWGLESGLGYGYGAARLASVHAR
jgi:hypothetical protein